MKQVGRRPKEAKLRELGMKPAIEVASWRMTVGNFAKVYPYGMVFINDYKEFPDLKRPILTIYDKLFDTVFAVVVGWHGTSARPVFNTVENIDPRLPVKQRVWGFNVGDEYMALTEDFVKHGTNGVRNFTLHGVPLVASWDDHVDSLGVWLRPSNKPISKRVDVDGRVGGEGESLQRLNTVKSGLFWFSWQNFFPQTKVNLEV